MLKRLLSNNQSGVALLMVMTTILILTMLLGDFTFESKLSRIKTTNLIDRAQAKLLAESGVELAMIRLKLYKEAYNTWAKNKDAQGNVSSQLVNQLWETPFVYPIPLGKEAGAQLKAAVDEFQKESILEGEFKLTIQNLSNKLNLNLLRLDSLTQSLQQQNGQGTDTDGDGIPDNNDADGDGIPDDQEDAEFEVDTQLVQHLDRVIREKREEDDAFNDRYGNVDIPQLVANLKYYVSDKGSVRAQSSSAVDALFANSENAFQEAGITPKFGPMTSFSEIYMVPGWDDQIVDLIKDEFGVFPSLMIDLNKITSNMLRLLIPNINDDEIKEFFEYRDDENEPHPFNTLDDFKRYVVEVANLMDETSFNERMQKFKAAGIQFGASPSMFKIVSEGTYNRTSYTMIVHVALPAQKPPRVQTPNPNGGNTQGSQGGGTTQGSQGGGDTQGSAGGGNTQGSQGGGNQNTQTMLLDPRIIEIQVN